MNLRKINNLLITRLGIVDLITRYFTQLNSFQKMKDLFYKIFGRPVLDHLFKLVLLKVLMFGLLFSDFVFVVGWYLAL